MTITLEPLPAVDDLDRRRFLGVGASLAVLAGCSAGAQRGPAGGDGFPRTVAHGFGETVVPARPQRVVSLGYSEADVAVALGTVPVAMRATAFGAGPKVTPWLAAALDAGGTPPELLDVGESVNLEQVAALRPDLILAGTIASIQDDYPRLSAIAPTLPWTIGYYQDPWQEQVRAIGAALGVDAAATALTARVAGGIAAVRSRHPGWAGRTFTVGLYTAERSFAIIVGANDSTYRFFSDLGLTSTPAVAGLARAGGGSGGGSAASVAMENAGLLDADVLLITPFAEDGAAKLAQEPLFQQLPAVQQKRVVYPPRTQIFGLRFPGPLSIPYLLAELEAPIAAALGS